MANSKNIELLKQGVEVWNSWRAKTASSRVDLTGADLTWAQLNGANLNRANLSRAQLDVANLSKADLNRANLAWAQLHLADLSKAQLSEARLNGANLSGAHLSGANLSGAYLNGANLSGANLSGANLSGAYLYRANLSGATVGYTVLTNTDLGEARGLEEVVHQGPSNLDIETIFSSKGKIPEVFLRGAGVPEILIQYLPSMIGQPIQFYSVFISYSHADKSFARQLHDRLQGKGIRCWLDEKQLLPGDDIYEQVDRAIRLWDKVLLCCSRDSLSSWWVDNEIDTALAKEQALFKERRKKVLALIPLNLDDYMFSDEWQSGKKQTIKSRLAADFTGWEHDYKKFEEQFKLVVRAVMTDDRGREIPPPSQL